MHGQLGNLPTTAEATCTSELSSKTNFLRTLSALLQAVHLSQIAGTSVGPRARIEGLPVLFKSPTLFNFPRAEMLISENEDGTFSFFGLVKNRGLPNGTVDSRQDQTSGTGEGAGKEGSTPTSSTRATRASSTARAKAR